VLRPGAGNPKGYWEAEIALKRNDQFLHVLGTSYHDPGLGFLDAKISPKARALHAKNIAAFLTGLPKASAVVVKDPRISGLVESWDEACRSLGLVPKYVHIHRHPTDVAASLKTRYGLPPGYAAALWLKYNLLPERMTRRAPRMFTSYRTLMNDWRDVVRKCNEGLNLTLTFDDKVTAEVDQFLASDLEHHRTAETAAVDDTTPGLWVRRTYLMLKSAAETGVVDEKEADRVFEEYSAAERFFRDAHRNYQDRFSQALRKRSKLKKRAP